jgi:hypothetical protein
MAVLNYSELDTLCLNAINTPPNYPVYYRNPLRVLYDTGCRPMEIFTPSLWSGNDISGYTLNPLKGNAPRYFPPGFTILDFRRYISGSSSNFTKLTYGKSVGIFKQFAYPYPIFAKSKDCDLYSYRYRYVRKLQLDGLTLAQITDHMGWADEAIATGYLVTPLNYY